VGVLTNSVEDRGQREVPLKLKMSETRILIVLYYIYNHGTGDLVQVCPNFGILQRREG
jgi:hypothetical protein